VTAVHVVHAGCGVLVECFMCSQVRVQSCSCAVVVTLSLPVAGIARVWDVRALLCSRVSCVLIGKEYQFKCCSRVDWTKLYAEVSFVVG